MGGVFAKIANIFPFVHAVEMEKALFSGNLGDALPHLLPVVVYSAGTTVVAVFMFLRQMKKQ